MDDFRLDELDSQVGCVGQFAAAVYGTNIYFISENGLYQFNGIAAKNISEERIPKLWATINQQYLSKAAVGIWDDLIWFSLPENTSTYNNLVIIYNPKKGTFWPCRGINASCFQAFNTGQDFVFYAGDSNAGYVNKQDTGDNDFGQAVNAYWEGKDYDMGSPRHVKKARKAYVEDSPDTENAVTLQVSLNYGDYEALTYRGEDNNVREFLFDRKTNWRYLSPKLIHNTTGPCEVRGIVIPHVVAGKKVV
jgi:hypothetical protein